MSFLSLNTLRRKPMKQWGHKCEGWARRDTIKIFTPFTYVYRLYNVGGAYVDTPTVLPLVSNNFRDHPVYNSKLSLSTNERMWGSERISPSIRNLRSRGSCKVSKIPRSCPARTLLTVPSETPLSNIIYMCTVWNTHLSLAQGLRIGGAVPVLPPAYRSS